MFQGFTDETFEFFMAIRFNNNTEFFHANHDWYMRAVRRPCLELAEALSGTIEALDDDLERRPNRVVSRINRDIRFSNDKSPYRDHLWLAFKRPTEKLGFHEERGSMPGFYFEVSADGACFGMGYYNENRPLMNGLRRRLLTEPEAFLDRWLPVREEFPAYLHTFKRMKLPENLHPALREWYPVRSFYLEKELNDFGLLKSPDLADAVAAGYRRLAPLFEFINSTPPETDGDETKDSAKLSWEPFVF